MEKIGLVKLFKIYVRDTEKEAPVVDLTITVCTVTKSVSKAANFSSEKIYITTRVLKHMYDKRPAEEFNYIIHNLWQISKFPDEIYENNNSKRGQFVFIKKLGKFKYFCSVEKTNEEDPDSHCIGMNYIVTAFRVEDTYLKSFRLLWSWKGGTPSS